MISKLFVFNSFIKKRLITKSREHLTNAKDILLIHKVRWAYIYYELVAKLHL